MNSNETESNGAGGIEFVDDGGTAAMNGKGWANSRPERATAALGGGRSVIVVGRNLTLDSWMGALTDGLKQARFAKAQGLDLQGFLKLLQHIRRE
jgi:hypothetical protein